MTGITHGDTHPGIKDKVMVKGDAASIIDLEKLESIVKDIMT